jgi:hypothetical protein
VREKFSDIPDYESADGFLAQALDYIFFQSVPTAEKCNWEIAFKMRESLLSSVALQFENIVETRFVWPENSFGGGWSA